MGHQKVDHTGIVLEGKKITKDFLKNKTKLLELMNEFNKVREH